MNTKYLTHKRKVIVSVHDADFKERLKPSAILQYFQDLATDHAEILNVGYCDMLEKNLYWVLSRLSYRVTRYPQIGEELVIITYPKTPGVVDVVRDYYIQDLKGETLISGTSKWCVIDTNTRAIKRCTVFADFPKDGFRPDDPYVGGNIRINPIISESIKSEDFEYKVYVTDLDRNVHMNNARYGDAILNSCNIEMLKNQNIKAFELNFLSELRVGDEYIVKRVDESNISTFEAFKKDGNKVVFRSQIEWLRQ